MQFLESLDVRKEDLKSLNWKIIVN